MALKAASWLRWRNQWYNTVSFKGSTPRPRRKIYKSRRDLRRGGFYWRKV